MRAEEATKRAAKGGVYEEVRVEVGSSFTANRR